MDITLFFSDRVFSAYSTDQNTNTIEIKCKTNHNVTVLEIRNVAVKQVQTQLQR